MRSHLDASECEHVVLGLIFLNYISDPFEEVHSRLLEKQSEGADPEDREKYIAENIFWVPPDIAPIWLSARQAGESEANRPRTGCLELINPGQMATC